MTDAKGFLRRFKLLWLPAWPLWTLVAFAILAATRLLPAGYIRAGVAAPMLFIVPGSVTLGAAFGRRHRPRGVAFVCWAALLGAIWSVFASLALYVCHVFITADSTYWCLLVISVVLAIMAQARLLLERQGRGRRVAHQPEIPDPDLSYAEVHDANRRAAARGTGLYTAVTAVAGISLLGGGLYAYDHHPNPAPPGYTWIAWTGSLIHGDIAVGSAGITLPFQIVHHQSGTTTFQLSAAWLGASSQPLAIPQTVSIGPNQTFRGALSIPALPNGCTYRITLVLTASRQIDPLTQQPQVWSINADVHDPSKLPEKCK